MASIPSSIEVPDSSRTTTTHKKALSVLTTLFFMWGLIAVMNDILIPYLKKMFELSRAGSMMVQMAFFTAYFTGSLLYFLISSRRGDPIEKIGYKNGMLLGLFTAAFGCLLFYPAAELKLYGFFLVALFILALGLALLQIAANPYVAIIGPPATASSRLNLAQGVNSLGTTLGPIVGGYFIFHFFATWGEPLLNRAGEIIRTDTGMPMTVAAVQLPYIAFAVLFLILAALVKFTELPTFAQTGKIEKGAGALRHRHLVLGMAAIFFYVGAEVSIGSLLINYIHELVGIPETQAKSYLAFYWGGLMIGRFLGAYTLSDSQLKVSPWLVMAGISLLTLLVIYTAVALESGFSFPVSQVLPFLFFIALNLVAFRLGRNNPAKTLYIFSLIVMGLIVAAMLLDGYAALWTVISIGLFISIMWSNIFTLAIADLGKDTAQGSSLLMMSVLGGALVPLLQGYVADLVGGYHYSFFVPLLCYVYLFYYGLKGHKVVR
ncbi:L-fucose:H+ symporter permease [Rhabdobacter roseus]|uniref:FHS family L-fucose permease-like MFS transporter n=1 Tax=Rhabdobacter roseus TaxID=1655419 RepID=A0A840TS68_9BACT|nr:sugar MFS transporter [Rhabdobacter roseus]MBB5284103.1 FHS family L-fucose permease-like MFS transporter [Rhabdobacter roseus]